MVSRVLIILHGLILALLSSLSLAGMPQDVTEQEYSMLPPYCPLRMTMGTRSGAVEAKESEYWAGILGSYQNLAPIHHYCWALVNLARGDKPSCKNACRTNNMEYSIGDIDYVIKHARPDFKLLPEIFTKRASVLARLKKYPEAAADYRKAAQAKPDYWPAYSGLAELYRETKQINEARAVVEEGLTHIPDSKTLNAMLADLKKVGAKSVPRKLESAPTRASANVPQAPAPETAPKDPAPQPEPSPAK